MSTELLLFKINEIQKDLVGIKQNMFDREKELHNKGKLNHEDMQGRWMEISHDFNKIYYILDKYRDDIIDIKIKEKEEEQHNFD